MVPNAKILITGGTGSWGKELTKLLLTTDAKEIVILSHSEQNLVNMSRSPEFKDSRLKFIIGDIRDSEVLHQSFQHIDYVFHLAALKHVPVCEDFPAESIKTNVTGTINVVNAAIACGVKQVIYVSTDKAVDPINTYGATKMLGEKIIVQANAANHKTKFVVIRGGNVLGTNGSVIPFFRDLIKKHNNVTLTDKTMTRFFITIKQAIKLLLDATEFTIGGEIFVIKMKSFCMKDVVDAIIETYGDSSTTITDIGLRPGEKIHELLISRNESVNSYHYDDNYFVILPTTKIDALHKHYDKLGLKRFELAEYNSSDMLSTKDDLKAMM